MNWFFKPKSLVTLPTSNLDALKKAYEELDQNARTLIRTDLQLHRANERFDQHIQHLEAIYSLGTLINSTFDIEVILNAVSASMARDMDFEKSGIVFLDKRGIKPVQSAYSGFKAMEYRKLLDRYDDVIHPGLEQEQEVFLQTALHATGGWAGLLSDLGLQSLLFLPMRIKSRLIGFIVGGRVHATLRLTSTDRRVYSMYAAQISTALENARLYETLGQLNLTLEEKVQERTHDLMEANERLRELDTVKSNFISLVSHELRTPLTAIKGFVATMLHFHKEITEEKREVYLSILDQETDRLTRLITELLDISRIESGRVEMKWGRVSLPFLIQKVFDTLAIKAGTVQLKKDFPDQFPDLGADIDKIEQIFINLIENAIKFSPPHSPIIIRGRQQEGGILITVHDAGPGIPFTLLEKVFDKFYRADNDTNRKYPGTGLGLPICRALVNLHGGKIWAESEPGSGTQFLMTLPLNWDKLGTPKETITPYPLNTDKTSINRVA